MRILTVRNPWAHAIVHLGKDVENRVTSIAGSYRGPVAIHVGLAFPTTRDYQTVKAITGSVSRATDRHDKVIGAGHIIGVVDLVDVHKAQVVEHGSHVSPTTREVTCCTSPWAEPTGVHLVLANPRPLSEPIPLKGALGLRRLDIVTTVRVLAQIGK